MPIKPEDRTNFHQLLLTALAEYQGRLAAGRLLPRLPDSRLGGERRQRMHAHETPQLFLQISGEAVMELPRESIRMRPGDLLLIPSGYFHVERAEHQREPFRNIVISYHQQNKIFAHLGVRGDDGFAHMHNTCREGFAIPADHATAQRPLHHLLEEVIAFAVENWASKEMIVRQLLLAHFSILRDLVAQRTDKQSVGSYKVAFVQQYVRKHLSDPGINVQALAQKAHCSADYLSNIFRKETAVSLTDYLNRCRVELAKTLLETSDRQITEIAVACGYSAPGYFARVFRQQTGQSPRTYRNQMSQPYERDTRTYEVLK